jgi:hypothetical protein
VLRDGPLALGGVERADALEDLGRQRRGGDADLRLGVVLLRQEHGEQRADENRHDQRDDQPPLPPAEHRDVVERVKGTFFHYRILTG